jgi:hypothetical protein
MYYENELSEEDLIKKDNKTSYNPKHYTKVTIKATEEERKKMRDNM